MRILIQANTVIISMARYGRITGNSLSNLPVDFMRKKGNCKVIIFEYIQILVKKDIKSSQEHEIKAPPYYSLDLCSNCSSMVY